MSNNGSAPDPGLESSIAQFGFHSEMSFSPWDEAGWGGVRQKEEYVVIMRWYKNRQIHLFGSCDI